MAVKRPKLTILIPVLLNGGTEAQTIQLVRAVSGAGALVSVCCYFESDTRTVEAVERAGSSVTQLGAGACGRRGSIGQLIRVGQMLYAHLVSSRPDFAHVQYLAPGLLPIMAARAARVPVVFGTVHQVADAYGVRERLMLRLAASLCTAFFCVSRAVEESWFGESEVFDPEKHLLRRRHATIYNGVDVGAYNLSVASAGATSIRRELGLADCPVVTVVGRLRWEKGQAVLVEAMSEVVRRVPGAALLVVGEGPDHGKLASQVAAAGLADRIVWAGVRPIEELPALYAISTVVVVPSVFEGFGLVAARW